MRALSLFASLAMVSTLIGCAKATPTQDLKTAALLCDVQGAKDALALKADVNSSAGGGDETPLMAAAYNGCADVARMLVAAGADVNAKTTSGFQTGATALSLGSTTRGNAETIKVLLAAGADVSARDAEGEIALGLAARYGHLEIVEALVAAGADLNTKGQIGQTPLQEAVFAGANMANNPNFGTVQGHANVADFLRAQGG